MKTAFSLPTPLFEKVEKLAKNLKISRSKLYQEAIQKYISDLDDKEITRKLNQVYDIYNEDNNFLKKSNRKIIKQNKW